MLLPAGLTVRRLMATVYWTLEGPHTKILMDGFQLETCETKASGNKEKFFAVLFLRNFFEMENFSHRFLTDATSLEVTNGLVLSKILSCVCWSS